MKGELNEQNLIKFTAEQNREEAKKNGKKGGKASAAARRRKKTVAEALREAGQRNISDIPGLEKIAKKYGLTGEDDILSLTTQAIYINELKKGNFKSLKELTEILGEQIATGTDEEKKQAELLTAIEKAVIGENGGE